jgi:serine/threonine protein kinase
LYADDPNATPGGTRIYMAPERLAGAPATAAADQFSLCVALWEALFRVRPWESNSTEIAGIVSPARARLRPAIPSQLVRVLRRGLAVEPTERHEDMGALADALSRVVLDAGRHEDRRLAVWVVVVVAGSIILALAWLVMGG